MTVSSNDYISLLQKQCSGNISATEANALAAWLKQSPENEHLAQQYLLVWEKSANYSPNIPIDLDTDFDEIRARIAATEVAGGGRAKVMPMQRWWLRAAAAVALLLCATWAWRQFGPSGASEIIARAAAEKQLVELPDGSQVWLRQGAQLAYPAQFEGKNRSVRLQGEAFFIVAHQPEAPFKVQMSDGGEVEVLGTQFDVRCRANDAYSSVLVKNGKVRFAPLAQQEGVVLSAQQKAVFDAQTKKVSIKKLDNLNDLAWQTGGLQFFDAPMSDALREIAEFYHIDVAVKNTAINHCRLTSPLTTGQSARNLLESIATANNLTLKSISETKYELDGNGCAQ